MRFKTTITEMFGIKYPILCGGMMWVSTPKLCAAISNSGGMGALTAGNYENEEEFRKAIETTRKLTNHPFMVNITLLPSVRITPEHHKMYVKVCAEERVAGIEFSGKSLDVALGLEWIEMLKKAEVKIFQKVGAVRHALHAEKVGYDGVYAAGFEEGGHPLDDDVTTMVLTPKIVKSVKIPVVAAGGMGDGYSLAAALALGAQGIMMATRFIATQESEVRENIKQEFIKKQEYETTIFGKTIGLQGRALKNKVIDEILAIEKRGGGLEEILPLIYGKRIKEAWETENMDSAPLMVGQSIGLIKDIPSCQKLIVRIVKEAIEQLSRVNKMVVEDP